MIGVMLGFVKIFGATGVALSSLVSFTCHLSNHSPHSLVQTIAIYTFIGAWRMKGISSMRITTAVVVGIWASIGILAVVALATNNDPSRPNLMGPVPVSTLDSS
jgi:hypothetical protein